MENWLPPLILVVVVYMVMEFIKTITYRVFPSAKERLIIKRVILPSLPPVIGFFIAVFVPLRPVVLNTIMELLEANSTQVLLVYGCYGAAIGQFSDYAYTKIKKLFGNFIDNLKQT